MATKQAQTKKAPAKKKLPSAGAGRGSSAKKPMAGNKKQPAKQARAK